MDCTGGNNDDPPISAGRRAFQIRSNDVQYARTTSKANGNFFPNNTEQTFHLMLMMLMVVVVVVVVMVVVAMTKQIRLSSLLIA